jgi:hypothetical protein
VSYIEGHELANDIEAICFLETSAIQGDRNKLSEAFSKLAETIMLERKEDITMHFKGEMMEDKEDKKTNTVCSA